MCHLTKRIWTKPTHNSAGSILVFLPGFHEIRTLGNKLISFFSEHNLTPLLDDNVAVSGERKNLFYLHSQISPEKQKDVFTGKQKKVILSTNIAETSLTIPDVNYVIDCGKQRMKLFEPGSQISMWSDVIISRSSAKQRAGRCGRLPGTFGACYHVFSKHTYEQVMIEQQQPELLRMPIHELCLSAKLLAANSYSISEFLSLAPDPPSERALTNAITLLKRLGALNDAEDLTRLGHQLVDLPIEPRLGKTVLASVVLKCLDPVLTIACALSYKDPFVIPTNDQDKRDLKRLKQKLSLECQSDHVLLVKAYREWQGDCYSQRSEISDYISYATMSYIKGSQS